jgi:hypothetical protein
MRRVIPWLGGVGLLLVGYVAGSWQAFEPRSLWAQGAADTAPELSTEAQTKIRAAADALRSAADALINDQKLTPATKGLNTFAILSGGRNVIDDLENGAIVDPETYAALYADLAVDQVAVHLGRDETNRLTYKGKVIRIYPVKFLMDRYRARAEFTGEELSPSPVNSARSKSSPKDTDEE